VLKPKDVQCKSRKKSVKEDCNFSHRWDLVVAGAAWKPPVCCTLERGGFLFMSKNVDWKLRQERGVLGVHADGNAVEVEEEEHERRLEFQPLGLKPKDVQCNLRKMSMKEDCNFSHR